MGKAEVRGFSYRLLLKNLGAGGGGWHWVYRDERPLIKNGSALWPSLITSLNNAEKYRHTQTNNTKIVFKYNPILTDTTKIVMIIRWLFW